jgi:pimeloyl-ACP methyl ester carboxylesterase
MFENIEIRTVDVGSATVAYRELGSGPTVVLVHGLLANGLLWARTAEQLATRFRVVVPDWPLGAHTVPLPPEADRSPAGVAALIADLLEALDLDDVTLVGNDTGGALCQIVVTTRPDRVGRLVLTPCDAYDNFLPAMFRPFQWLARVPGSLRLTVEALRYRPARRLPMTFGGLSKRPLPDALTDAFLAPARSDPRIRRDLAGFLRGIDPAATWGAAARFDSFTRPVLLAWAAEDRFFPLRHAQAMAAAFPDARLERIDDSATLVSIDQPERTAALIASFVDATQRVR